MLYNYLREPPRIGLGFAFTELQKVVLLVLQVAFQVMRTDDLHLKLAKSGMIPTHPFNKTVQMKIHAEQY